MASAAWPAVIAAVFSTAEAALPNVRVIRGRNIVDAVGDVVLIGLRDPESDPCDAGSFRQTMQSFGGNREEVGEVNGVVVASNGNPDQDLACSTAFDHLAAIEAAVRTDPTLGLTGYDYVFAEMQGGDIGELQDGAGATAYLAFTISYKIRI